MDKIKGLMSGKGELQLIDTNILDNFIKECRIENAKQNETIEMLIKNFKPTQKNKRDLNTEIKLLLGVEREDGEVEEVKRRVMVELGVKTWQDVPYLNCTQEPRSFTINLIEKYCTKVKSDRIVLQTNIFDKKADEE